MEIGLQRPLLVAASLLFIALRAEPSEVCAAAERFPELGRHRTERSN